jgi:type III secretion protein L
MRRASPPWPKDRGVPRSLMKYFTLIYGDRVARATGAKIIPAEEFSKLLEGQELVEHIQQEADRYRQEVVAECEKLKEEAERQGFQAGLEKWSEQIAHLEKEIHKVSKEMVKALAPVALQATKKVIGRELEIHPDILAEIVTKTLKSVSSHRRIVIYCNRNDLPVLEKNKEMLKGSFEQLESLVINERGDVEPGGVVIETEAGIINAQLENQWRALSAAFEALLR